MKIFKWKVLRLLFWFSLLNVVVCSIYFLFMSNATPINRSIALVLAVVFMLCCLATNRWDLYKTEELGVIESVKRRWRRDPAAALFLIFSGSLLAFFGSSTYLNFAGFGLILCANFFTLISDKPKIQKVYMELKYPKAVSCLHRLAVIFTAPSSVIIAAIALEIISHEYLGLFQAIFGLGFFFFLTARLVSKLKERSETVRFPGSFPKEIIVVDEGDISYRKQTSRASLSIVNIGENGATHEFLIGTTCYGKGQSPKAGHKPQVVINVDKDHYQFSKAKVEAGRTLTKKRELLELLVSFCIIGLLIAGYVTQHILHWW